jgi:hypothetical protein
LSSSRQALAAFAAEDTAYSMRQRHACRTPEQMLTEHEALETAAAARLKIAA